MDLQLREQVLAKLQNGFATFSESQVEAIEGRVALYERSFGSLYRSFVCGVKARQLKALSPSSNLVS